MKRKRKGNTKKEVISMRSILITVLLTGLVFLIASSCATVPKAPLVSDEVRLLSIDVLGTSVEANVTFPVNIFFEAAGHPEIKRACFYEPGEEASCSDVSLGTFGTKRYLQAYVPGLNVGPHTVECYAEYIRDGEIRKTNVITTRISPVASRGG
jgi:hypothetical protein